MAVPGSLVFLEALPCQVCHDTQPQLPTLSASEKQVEDPSNSSGNHSLAVALYPFVLILANLSISWCS